MHAGLPTHPYSLLFPWRDTYSGESKKSPESAKIYQKNYQGQATKNPGSATDQGKKKRDRGDVYMRWQGRCLQKRWPF